MIPRSTIALLVVLAGCGGAAGPTAGARPSATPEQAVRSFMQAAADSNLTRMAELWGTRAGPASKTGQPPDYERRLVIMQFYLSGTPFRLVPGGAAQFEPATPDSGPSGEPESTRQVVVQLDRPGCTKFVPFFAVKTADNVWLINRVDLVAAGHPHRGCPTDRNKAPADSG